MSIKPYVFCMFLHEGIYFIFWPSNSVTMLLELKLKPFLILQFEFNFKLFCSTLQMFTGLYGVPVVFSAISMEKGCKNHRETLYSSKGKIVYVVGKPCNIYRLGGTPRKTLAVHIWARIELWFQKIWFPATRRVSIRALFCNTCLCFGQYGSSGLL